jgi:AcrR family transcriptional regulator
VPRMPAAAPPRRQTAQERRGALLAVARTLVLEGGPAAVTMGTVADRADVTRALVYKHFDNRDDILAALYRHDAAALDRQLRGKVATANDGFEPKLRSFVHVVVEATDTHAAFFAPLRPFGHDPTQRRQQRSWDRRTLDYFTTLAAHEFGLDETTARPALGVLLSGLVSLLTQARADRSPAGRAAMEDVFVDLAMGGLRNLAAGTGRVRPA